MAFSGIIILLLLIAIPLGIVVLGIIFTISIVASKGNKPKTIRHYKDDH